MPKACELCPRMCGTDRDISKGFCGCGSSIRIAKYMVHRGEEPCISGINGSGAVFFSGCSLRCVFCQNHVISRGLKGEDITGERLSEIFFELKKKGVHNINLVTGTHFSDKIADVLKKCKDKLGIPVIFNCGGYERAETLETLDGLIDVYLPDIKYYDSMMSERYSKAADYFETAIKALSEMKRQQPENIFDENGMIKKGVIVRHLVLPKGYKDSIRILEEIKKRFDGALPLVSIMRQYTPCNVEEKYPEINRTLTSFEYNKVTDKAAELGFEGFTQEKGCETFEMTPDF